MTTNMEKLLKVLSENEELGTRFSKLDKSNIIAAARELGIELTEEDFQQPDGEMSDDELTSVAGGKACYCAIAGGGCAGGDDDVCACVAFGLGYIAEDSQYPYYRGKARCCCPMGGDGKAAEEFVTFCNCGGVVYDPQ